MSPSPNFSETDVSLGQSIQSFYDILGVSPQSTQNQIRDAYRGKSKKYHPDTAKIDKDKAAEQFQALNTAYDTLRFPEKRNHYDEWLRQQQIHQSIRLQQQKRPPSSSESKSSKVSSNSAFLGPDDRQLSPGEVFALFILGLTFIFCLLVAIFLGVSRGEMLVESMPSDSSLVHQLESFKIIPNPKKEASIAKGKESTSTSHSSNISKSYSAAIHQAQKNPTSKSLLFPVKPSS